MMIEAVLQQDWMGTFKAIPCPQLKLFCFEAHAAELAAKALSFASAAGPKKTPLSHLLEEDWIRDSDTFRVQGGLGTPAEESPVVVGRCFAAGLCLCHGEGILRRRFKNAFCVTVEAVVFVSSFAQKGVRRV